MKFNKIILFCLCIVMMVGGCRNNAQQKPEGFDESYIFFSDLPEEELTKPENIVHNREQFSYALDYLAFYRISDPVWITFSTEYEQTFFNPYTEFQKAYDMADLTDVYPCQLDDTHWSDLKAVSVRYSIAKDTAAQRPTAKPASPVVYSFDDIRLTSDISIPLEEDQQRIGISCENSEQLYWLAMNGYRPLPQTGSMADTLWQAAKEVLSQIIEPDMDDFSRIKAVYDWMTTEVVYDRETADTEQTYLVSNQSYYLEGVLLNHLAVCDGKAKAYALLLNMLEIPCYRDTGVNEAGWNHAWNMVELDGKWYISCTTYGQSDETSSIGRRVPNYAMLLAGKETPYGEKGWGYQGTKHPDIRQSLQQNRYEIYAAMAERDHVPLVPENSDELNRLVQQAKPEKAGEYKVEFEIGPTSSLSEQEIIEGTQGQKNTILEKIPSEGGTVYQLIYLENDAD